jgi:hypothetical protein
MRRPKIVRCIIRSAAHGLAPILLIALSAACAGPPPIKGPTPTSIPTLIPVPEATATIAPSSAATQPQPNRGQPRRPAQETALSTFATADFAGPGLCSACHVGLTDETGTDVSMPTAWRSTMMANAAKDPVWQAKVASEVARFPVLQGVIEKKCVTCHMPMAETEAAAEGRPVVAQADGFFSPANPLHPAAIDGVSCTLCHQIRDVNFGKMESFSGGYVIDTSTNPPDRPIFGPYERPVARVMQVSTGFDPMYGAQMVSAEHCATCHNLYTPYVDAEGNILGEFAEQTPFTEWENSSFGASGASCQGCHLPQAQGGVVISIAPANLAPRRPFYQHFFVGGNAFMLKILRDWGGELEVTADPVHFESTMGRVTDQVGQRAAALTLKSLEVRDDRLEAQMQVFPLTGHKFPTSFPSRRTWLHVTVTDGAGKVLFESGKPSADGTIAGNAADSDRTRFEPHYDVISRPDQVQIYEPIMGDNEGNVTYTLLRAAKYLKDNRLLPAGADKAKLPAEVAVYGEAASDANFQGGGDLVTYLVDVEEAIGPFTLSAELLYEPLSYQFVQDLLTDNTPLTDRFGGYYAETDKSPLRVAVVEPAETH